MSQQDDKIKVDLNSKPADEPKKDALPVIDSQSKEETTESGCCGVCGG